MERTIREATVEGVKIRQLPTTKHFVYSVKVTWSDGQVNVVSRRYSEFLALQEKLIAYFKVVKRKQYSEEMSKVPTLPGKRVYGISPGSAMKKLRRITDFIKELTSLSRGISQSEIVLDFFKPTLLDLEVDISSKGRKNAPKKKPKHWNLPRKEKRKSLQISGPVICAQYEAIADYDKDHKGGITLRDGAIVDVIEKNETGWWLVDCDGEKGWAPSSYLQQVGIQDDIMTSAALAQGQGVIYVSTKAYKAQFDDELTFDVGVNLLVSEINMDGWWKAGYMGREGLVPAVCLRKLGEDSIDNIPQEKSPKKSVINPFVKEIIKAHHMPDRRRSVKKVANKRRTKPETRIQESKQAENHKSPETNNKDGLLGGISPSKPGEDRIQERSEAQSNEGCDAEESTECSLFDPSSSDHIRKLRDSLAKSSEEASSVDEISVESAVNGENADKDLENKTHLLNPNWTSGERSPSSPHKRVSIKKSHSFNTAREKYLSPNWVPCEGSTLSPSYRKKLEKRQKARSKTFFGSNEMKSLFQGIVISTSLYDPRGEEDRTNGSVQSIDTLSTEDSLYNSDFAKPRARSMLELRQVQGESNDTGTSSLSSSAYSSMEAGIEMIAVNEQALQALSGFNSAESDSDKENSPNSELDSGSVDGSSDNDANNNELVYIAIEDYPGSEDGTEVELARDEEVRVVKKSECGWWYVKTKTSEGWAPSNYLGEEVQ